MSNKLDSWNAPFDLNHDGVMTPEEKGLRDYTIMNAFFSDDDKDSSLDESSYDIDYDNDGNIGYNNDCIRINNERKQYYSSNAVETRDIIQKQEDQARIEEEKKASRKIKAVIWIWTIIWTVLLFWGCSVNEHHSHGALIGIAPFFIFVGFFILYAFKDS